MYYVNRKPLQHRYGITISILLTVVRETCSLPRCVNPGHTSIMDSVHCFTKRRQVPRLQIADQDRSYLGMYTYV